jgi:glycosyltransferase involved in cell wall biosynthesis
MEMAKKGVCFYVSHPALTGKVTLDKINLYGLFYGFKKISKVLSKVLSFSEYCKPLFKVYGLAYSIANFLYIKSSYNVTEEVKPDLIHAHFAGYQAYIAKIIKKLSLKPLIVTVHGYDVLIEPSINYGLRMNKNADLFVKNNLKAADAVIVNSRILYKECFQLGVPNEKLHLIHQGVDVKKFSPNIDGSSIRKLYQLEDKFVILSMKSHEAVYGIEYIIRAIHMLVNDFGHKEVTLMICGKGKMTRNYLQLAHKLGITKNIKFVGLIDRSKVPLFYAASDIVVIASLIEGFSLVGIEALAMGKPVIGTKVGAIPEYIFDGKNGFLVSQCQAKEIAEKVMYFFDNPNEIKRMGNIGRQIVEDKFNIEKRAEKIIKLYNSIC